MTPQNIYLISAYRIFIRSKKLTFRMIAHSIDFAQINIWLEQRWDFEFFGIYKKKVRDLLHFRMRVANGFLKEQFNKPNIDDQVLRPGQQPHFFYVSPINSIAKVLRRGQEMMSSTKIQIICHRLTIIKKNSFTNYFSLIEKYFEKWIGEVVG